MSARVRESQTRARRDGLVLGSPSYPLPCLPIPLDDVARVNWLNRVCGYQSLVDEGGYLAAGDVAGGGKLLARGIVDRDFALCGGCYGVGGKTGNLSSIDLNAQRIGIAAGKLQAVYQRFDRLSSSQILQRAKRAVWISSQKHSISLGDRSRAPKNPPPARQQFKRLRQQSRILSPSWRC